MRRLDIGKHGRWKSIGGYRWCKASIPEADQIGLIRVKSWLLCTKPPAIHESFTDFRRSHRESSRRTASSMMTPIDHGAEFNALGNPH